MAHLDGRENTIIKLQVLGLEPAHAVKVMEEVEALHDGSSKKVCMILLAMKIVAVLSVVMLFVKPLALLVLVPSLYLLYGSIFQTWETLKMRVRGKFRAAGLTSPVDHKVLGFPVDEEDDD